MSPSIKIFGMVFLAIFLIAFGVAGLGWANLGVVVPILALVTAVLILIGK